MYPKMPSSRNNGVAAPKYCCIAARWGSFSCNVAPNVLMYAKSSAWLNVLQSTTSANGIPCKSSPDDNLRTALYMCRVSRVLS